MASKWKQCIGVFDVASALLAGEYELNPVERIFVYQRNVNTVHYLLGLILICFDPDFSNIDRICQQ